MAQSCTISRATPPCTTDSWCTVRRKIRQTVLGGHSSSDTFPLTLDSPVRAPRGTNTFTMQSGTGCRSERGSITLPLRLSSRECHASPSRRRFARMTRPEAQAYIDAIAERRGYAPAYHKIMALHDFDVLQAMNGLARATFEENRELDPRVKQLLYIAALTVVRAGSEFLTSHIDRSLELGTSAQEILESIELALPVAGVVRVSGWVRGLVSGDAGVRPRAEDYRGACRRMTSHQKGDTKTTRTDGTKSLGPLSGIRVVDVSNTFMVPYATLLMVQMGAEVIKVEEPDGDILRQVGDVDGAAAGPVFLNVNRGKRSIVLDITRPSDYERLLLLVQTADVFTHNRPAAVARRLGIDYDTLSEVNPTLIHCGAFGYGSDGPYRDLPAYDDVIQAASGFASVQSGDGDPQYVRSAVADKTTALFVVAGALAALFERERSGMGQAVEIPMFEAMVSFLFLEQQGGAVYDPPRGPTGYKRIDSPFRHPYRTSDGLIGVMIYTDRQWRSFFDLIEKPQLSEDARFATIEALRHRPPLRNP